MHSDATTSGTSGNGTPVGSVPDVPPRLLAAFPHRPVVLRLPPLPPGAVAGYVVLAALGVAALGVAAAWAAGLPPAAALAAAKLDGLPALAVAVALPVLGAVAAAQFHGVLRRRRRAGRLSGQVLVPAAMEAVTVLDVRFGTLWRLRDAPGRPAVDWSFARGARPFLFFGPLTGAPRVLGVTAPGAGVVVPLDKELTWLGLTDEERCAVGAAAGA